jgi:hypothetical protein
MSQQQTSRDGPDVQAFATRLQAFRASLPQDEQLLLDAVVLTACRAQPDVQGYGVVGILFERLRAYWLDPKEFDPREELIRPDQEADRALLNHVRGLM